MPWRRPSRTRIPLVLATAVATVFVGGGTALANSSWHWMTPRPWDLLPAAVALTLAIESAIIARWGKIGLNRRTVLTVAAANLMSFVAPYILRAWTFWRVFRMPFKAFDGPYYTIGGDYLLLTLLVEVPIVYLLLRDRSGDRRWLLPAAIAANVLTTLLVFGIERFFCRGAW